MKAIDIVKPEPKTEFEVFERWCNSVQSRLLTMTGRKIEVQKPCDFCGQLVGASAYGNVCNNCAEENYNDGSGDF